MISSFPFGRLGSPLRVVVGGGLSMAGRKYAGLGGESTMGLGDESSMGEARCSCRLSSANGFESLGFPQMGLVNRKAADTSPREE